MMQFTITVRVEHKTRAQQQVAMLPAERSYTIEVESDESLWNSPMAISDRVEEWLRSSCSPEDDQPEPA